MKHQIQKRKNLTAAAVTLWLSLGVPACAKSNFSYPNFSISNYFGNTPLEFRVNSDGKVRVLDYPKKWTSQLQILQMSPIGLYKDLSDSTCQNVEAEAKHYSDPLLPELTKDRALEKVRKANPVSVQVDVASRFQPTAILVAVREKLREKDILLPNLTLENRIVLESIKFNVLLESNAITHNIGKTQDLERLFSDKFSAGIIRNGAVSGELATMDILCDLNHSKARLSVKVTGIEASAVKGKLLINLDTAKAIVEDLQTAKDEFLSGDAREEFGRNRILATAIVLGTLAKSSANISSRKDLANITEHLTHPVTGIPIILTQEQLQGALTAYEFGDSKFGGDSDLTLMEKGSSCE